MTRVKYLGDGFRVEGYAPYTIAFANKATIVKIGGKRNVHDGTIIERFEVAACPDGGWSGPAYPCRALATVNVNPLNPLDPDSNFVFISDVFGGCGYGACVVDALLEYAISVGCVRAKGYLYSKDLDDPNDSEHKPRLFYFWGEKMGFDIIPQDGSMHPYRIEKTLSSTAPN